MKAIMISDKPKWCALMMNGDKTVEVRTSKSLYKAIQKLIDENGYADIYVYCSKNGGNLVYGTEYRGGGFVDEYGITRGFSKQKANEIFGLLNGKVLFKFRCYKVEEIPNYGLARRSEIMMEDLLKKSCLTLKQLNEYAPHKEYEDDCIYAIHISDLEIFDKPKELSEFRKPSTLSLKQLRDFGLPYTKEMYKDMMKQGNFIITKAPQNFCYVEVIE